MESKQNSELDKLQIADQIRGIVITKCEEIEKEVMGYKSFLLDRRPDSNLSSLLEKAADLRKAQDRVSSIRLDIMSLQRVAKEKIKKYKVLLKDAEAEATLEVNKEVGARRVNKDAKDAMIRGKIGDIVRLVADLENIYDRTNFTLDIVKEIDGNLRDSGIQLSNQINVIDKMVRNGEVKSYQPQVDNGKARF